MTRVMMSMALLLGACSSSSPSHSAPPDMAPATMVRTLVHNPLFGDTHPQNLFIDPNFSVRGSGVGTWLAEADSFVTTSTPAFAGSLMSDSPAGIALGVARLADNAMATEHSELSLIAQVPGGPGPFHLRVWVSTLDATTSADVSAVAVSLVGSLTQSDAAQIMENSDAAKVIAGRTWHLFEGDLMDDRPLGAFVLFDFKASANTWLLQAPEFAPTALLPSPTPELARRHLVPAKSRPMTSRERALIDKYIHQPRISVPASHPSISGRDRDPR